VVARSSRTHSRLRGHDVQSDSSDEPFKLAPPACRPLVERGDVPT